MVARPGSFAVVLPVKSPGTGKSRLSTLSDADRRRLAAAFAADVVETCHATASVGLLVVVSDDGPFAASLAGSDGAVLADPGRGLNAALRHGAAHARALRPGLRPVALLADLPALAADDLAAALDHVASRAGACFVVDADGSGTTLYTAPHEHFSPRFGAGSADAHLAAGAEPVPGALATLRRDVDDLDGLTAALALGLGPATRAAVDTLALT